MDFFFFVFLAQEVKLAHKLERNRGKFGRSAWRIKGGDQRDDNDPKLVEYVKKMSEGSNVEKFWKFGCNLKGISRYLKRLGIFE